MCFPKVNQAQSYVFAPFNVKNYKENLLHVRSEQFVVSELQTTLKKIWGRVSLTLLSDSVLMPKTFFGNQLLADELMLTVRNPTLAFNTNYCKNANVNSFKERSLTTNCTMSRTLISFVQTLISVHLKSADFTSNVKITAAASNSLHQRKTCFITMIWSSRGTTRKWHTWIIC